MGAWSALGNERDLVAGEEKATEVVNHVVSEDGLDPIEREVELTGQIFGDDAARRDRDSRLRREVLLSSQRMQEAEEPNVY